MARIFEITEHKAYYHPELDAKKYYYDFTYYVDEAKIEPFKNVEENEHVFKYIQPIIEAALNGTTFIETATEFSFGGDECWYEDIQTQPRMTDEVIKVIVHVG